MASEFLPPNEAEGAKTFPPASAAVPSGAPTSGSASAHDQEFRRRGRRLCTFVILAVAALMVFYALTTDIEDPLHLYQAMLIIVLATLPGILWAKGGGIRLPVFEVYALMPFNTYALPLLNGHNLLQTYPPEVVTTAAWTVLLFQVLLFITFIAVRGRPSRSRFLTEEIINQKVSRFIGYGLNLTTIYAFVSTFTDWIPYEYISIARALFSGLGLVCVFVETQRWGRGEIHPREFANLIINLFLQIVLHLSTLFLVDGLSLLVLALVGYVSGSRRLPVIPILAILAITAVLHNGKSAMRDRYWDIAGNDLQPTFTELPAFFSEWFQEGLQTDSLKTKTATESDSKLTSKLFDRTSLLHILCLVVHDTPDRRPFLDGETYKDIPGQFIPRFFWPEKPRGHVSTYRLAVHFGLQNEEDTIRTTIGFGMLSEAYANFGTFGVVLLAIVLGAFYKKVQTSTAESPLLSFGGLFLIILMAWSFQTEFTLSIWLGSMFQACVAAIGVPFAVRRIFG